ncbi:MAG TPA: flagellin [Sphingobium sp.]
MLIVGTNVVALRAQNSMRVATAAMQQSMQRLTTGKRINSPADDPAGFAIAVGMTSRISGMTRAMQNAQDGISLAQTAEGALADVTTMAQRIRELAVNATSGTYSDADRANMNAESAQLLAQVGQVLTNSKFNGNTLFDTTAAGPGTSRPIQVGSEAGETMDLTIENIDMTWAASASMGTASDANGMLSTMDGFLKKLSTVRADLGAKQSGLEATVNILNTGVMNMIEARSRIEDADYGAESMALAKAQIMVQSSTAMLAQANQMQKAVLTLIT